MKAIVPVIVLLLTNLFSNGQDSATIQFAIHEKHPESVVPANIRIWNDKGEYVFPDSLYMWKSFFGKVFPEYPSTGSTKIRLSEGKYHYSVDRGPEYLIHRDSFSVDTTDFRVDVFLKRIADMKNKGWWAGDLHVHRNLRDIELLMKCSDLHVAPVITSWNEHYYIKPDSIYDARPVRFDGNRFYTSSGSEDERNGGALLALNVDRPVDFSKDHRPEYPPLVKSAERIAADYGSRYWIDVDKPFWRDMPLLLTTGKINSVGIAHNHMNIDGDFDTEALGIARDKKEYPSPTGNGYYTQDLYYHILNCGFRIPPSAGSASGVLLNPVGYNRMYVYTGKHISYEKWFDEAAKGKVFVTNGPLIDCKANGHRPGKVFSAGKSLTIHIRAEIFSRDTVDRVELIHNGKIVQTGGAGNFSARLRIDRSGWFLVRVICNTPGRFRFASTAPYYVEVGREKKIISKSSVNFFMNWLEKTRRNIQVEDVHTKEVVDEVLNDAEQYWQKLALSVNAE